MVAKVEWTVKTQRAFRVEKQISCNFSHWINKQNITDKLFLPQLTYSNNLLVVLYDQREVRLARLMTSLLSNYN
jgi:hypothetical protein